MPVKKILLQLQETLLEAILSGKPLPGLTGPTRFPDLSFLLRQPVIYLLDVNLAGPARVNTSHGLVRTLSEEALMKEADKQGDITYLQFQPPDVADGEITLALGATIAPRDPNQQRAGLSTIVVKFIKIANEWKVVDEPASLSA